MSAKVTFQDTVRQVEILKPKITALITSASAFQATDGVDKALKIHAEVLVVKEGIDLVASYVAIVQSPISLDDGNAALSIARELQQSWNIAMDLAIKKKSMLDALPAGNVTALIGHDLELLKQSMLGLAKRWQDSAPAELKEEMISNQKEFEDVVDKAIRFYS